jgi:hypothetical protein
MAARRFHALIQTITHNMQQAAENALGRVQIGVGVAHIGFGIADLGMGLTRVGFGIARVGLAAMRMIMAYRGSVVDPTVLQWDIVIDTAANAAQQTAILALQGEQVQEQVWQVREHLRLDEGPERVE